MYQTFVIVRSNEFVVYRYYFVAALQSSILCRASGISICDDSNDMLFILVGIVEREIYSQRLGVSRNLSLECLKIVGHLRPFVYFPADFVLIAQRMNLFDGIFRYSPV